MEILSDTLFRGNVTIDEDQKLVFQTPSIRNNPTSAISQQLRGSSEVLVIESSGWVSVEKCAHMTHGLKVDDNFVVVCDCSSFVFDNCSGGRLKLINDKSVTKIQMNGVDGSICAGSLNLGGNICANNVSVCSITASSGASFMGNDFTCGGIVNGSQSNWSITHGSYTNTFPQKSGTLATVDDIPTVGLKVYRQQLEIDASTIPENCTAFSFGSYSPLTKNAILGSGSDAPRESIVSTQAYHISKDGTTPFTYPSIEIELVCGDVIGKKASGLSLEGTLGVNMLAVI